MVLPALLRCPPEPLNGLDENYTDRYIWSVATDNREHILETALRLFAERGYAAVGVQEIVREAGVTKPTLYHYFHSKRGLLASLLQRHCSELVGALDAALTSAGDIVHSLNETARGFYGLARREPAFYRLFLALWLAPTGSEEFQAAWPWHRNVLQRLERRFEHAAARHGNMRGRHEAFAATFIGMVYTYISLAARDLVELTDELAYRSVHQFMHGIFS